MKKKRRRKALTGEFLHSGEMMQEYFDDDLEEDDYYEGKAGGEEQPEDIEYLDEDAEEEYPEEEYEYEEADGEGEYGEAGYEGTDGYAEEGYISGAVYGRKKAAAVYGKNCEKKYGKKCGKKCKKKYGGKKKKRIKHSGKAENQCPKERKKKRRYGIRHMEAADYAAAAAGILLLAGAAALGIFCVNVHAAARQVASFAEVGTQMEGISVIGESGLLAMAEAQNRKAAMAEAEAAEEAAVFQYEEKELYAKGSIAVEMHLSSMQKDLKIKFVNKETGRLISSVPFEVTVVDADKKTYALKDEDMDGIIYRSDAVPGPCSVTMTAVGQAQEYAIPTESVTATIKDTIEYKKVDVTDEIKKESEVNAAVEDTKRVTAEESALTDTVGFVESAKKKTEAVPDAVASDAIEKGENGEYEEVSKEDVAWPAGGDTAESGGEDTTQSVEEDAAEPGGEDTAQSVGEDGAESAGEDGAGLMDKGGNPLYVIDEEGNFREAVRTDYDTAERFYRKKKEEIQKEEIQKEEIQEEMQEEETPAEPEYQYTGWQTLDGKTYYFDADGNKVTGEQVIQGARYSFDSEGVLSTASGNMGIDVSKWNGSIDWNAVKNSGVSYVIIRCGYRGSTTGALIEDPMFRTNIQGAASAGLKVGIYFVTQAVNEAEAVEEASMAVSLISGYHISYPVFLDVEPGGGRADGISREMRTAVCRAFCQTMENSGYRAGIYSNSTWLNEKIDTPSLTDYKIWLAQYTAEPTYTKTKYDLWQYSAKGTVAGIQGETDLNISYLE